MLSYYCRMFFGYIGQCMIARIRRRILNSVKRLRWVFLQKYLTIFIWEKHSLKCVKEFWIHLRNVPTFLYCLGSVCNSDMVQRFLWKIWMNIRVWKSWFIIELYREIPLLFSLFLRTVETYDFFDFLLTFSVRGQNFKTSFILHQ